MLSFTCTIPIRRKIKQHTITIDNNDNNNNNNNNNKNNNNGCKLLLRIKHTSQTTIMIQQQHCYKEIKRQQQKWHIMITISSK